MPDRLDVDTVPTADLLFDITTVYVAGVLVFLTAEFVTFIRFKEVKTARDIPLIVPHCLLR